MMASLKLPNLIILGVTKAGTTSVFAALAEHSDICGSSTKETYVLTPARFGGVVELEQYSKVFSHFGSEKYLMESTPSYFYGSSTIADVIATQLPGAKLLLVLREPAERCYSLFRFNQSRHQLPTEMTFAEYLGQCRLLGERPEQSRDLHPYRGLTGGRYSHYIEPWLGSFTNSGLRVAFFDDLRRDPTAFLRGTLEWLNLSQDARIQIPTENRTTLARNSKLQSLALKLNSRLERPFRQHPAVKVRLRGAYYALNRQRPSDAKCLADNSLLDELRLEFHDSNAATADSLMRYGVTNLPSWLCV